MSLPPSDIPLGAMRFNSDSQKLEYWNGEIWMQVHTFSPNLDGGARGMWFCGSTPGDNEINNIEYYTIPTQGNGIDFGDATVAVRQGCALSSSTRGLHLGGFDGSDRRNEIGYVTISSTGNAADFGDLKNGAQTDGCTASPTRGLIMFGAAPGSNYYNTIEYVTIASTGNAQDFGDTPNHAGVYGNTAGGNSIRGISYGGAPSAPIEYVTIASTGNATLFGDFIPSGHSTQVRYTASFSSSTRMVIGGGYTPGAVEDYYYLNISTEGTFVEFGDLSVNSQRKFSKGCTNGHGGL